MFLFLGLSDIPGEAMVKLYCPKCMDVYTPKSSRHHHTDGAYFGTGFPHMLFMVHPEYRPKRPANQFVPRFVSFIWKSSVAQHILLISLKRIFLHHVLFLQAVWFQDSPNGLPATAAGSLQLQESCQSNPLKTLKTRGRVGSGGSCLSACIAPLFSSNSY